LRERENGVISEAGGKQKQDGSSRFYKTRRRVYGSLLFLVIAAGLPMTTVPALRHRLMSRMHVLKTAFSGDTSPVMAQVGEKQEPFPAEYERPSPPSVAHVLKMPAAPTYDAPEKEVAPARTAPRRTLRIPPVGEPLPSADKGEASDEQSKSAPAIDSENQPKYRQGTIEREAYDLLLKSNPAIAGLAQGNSPSLQFLSWDAAGRGEDIYWVRLKFRSEGKPDIEYIWQVQLQSKGITPLNYNARTLQ
jgi:hypothetical protein